MSEHFVTLKSRLMNFALTESDIAESSPFWISRRMNKGSFFNMPDMVCDDLGFIVKGIFRIYYVDPETGDEKNLFFFSENQFLVSFRSFITRKICQYFIQALEDSEIICISYDNLSSLYETHPHWIKFGKLLAELFFTHSQTRAEELLFTTEGSICSRALPAYLSGLSSNSCVFDCFAQTDGGQRKIECAKCGIASQ